MGASQLQDWTTQHILECFIERGNRARNDVDGRYFVEEESDWCTEFHQKGMGNGRKADLMVTAVYKHPDKEDWVLREQYIFEIKSGTQDLNTGYGMNFIGDRNFIIVPDFIGGQGLLIKTWKKLNDLGRKDVGILSIDRHGTITCWRESWQHKLYMGHCFKEAFGDTYIGCLI